MENDEKYITEHLLPDYLSGEISEENRQKVDCWRNLSSENNEVFKEISAVWELEKTLTQMEQFNAKDALKKVDKQLLLYGGTNMFWQNIQRVAAILLIPVLIYAGVITFSHFEKTNIGSVEVTRQKIKTTTGMISELVLPDGTRVWLNHGTILEYPLIFGKEREVYLLGEAYFEVKEDKKHPFIVHTGTIGVEVLGTSFNVANYPDENQTSVVLISGNVQLFTGTTRDGNAVASLKPYQKAVYNRATRKFLINQVDVDEYSVWKDGILMFVNDPMDEVTKKLSRWFNVDIELKTNELHDYVYKATFKDESLTQILDLLKLSAPIEYSIKPRAILPNGDYSKQKVIIRRR